MNTPEIRGGVRDGFDFIEIDLDGSMISLKRLEHGPIQVSLHGPPEIGSMGLQMSLDHARILSKWLGAQCGR